MSSTLSAYDLERALTTRDLTDPGQGRHAIQLIVDRLADALPTAWRSAWSCSSLFSSGACSAPASV